MHKNSWSVLFFLIAFINGNVNAQNGYYKNWIFGINAKLIFDSTGVNTSSSICINNFNNSTVSDSNGNLIAYLSCEVNEICHLRDSNNQIIENGDSVVSIQSMNSIFINNDDKFNKLLYITPYNYKRINCEFGIFGCNRLRYSVLENINGNYTVTLKNQILSNIAIDPVVAAVKHSNGNDWWVIAHAKGYQSPNYCSDMYVKYLFTNESNYGPIIQNIGQPICGSWNYCEIAVSKDGNLIAFGSTQNGKIDLFSFNRCTGELFNHRIVDNGLNNFYPMGICFSPDNSRLYISTATRNIYNDVTPIGKIYQYNLLDTNIVSSKQLIITSGSGINWLHLELAPDNRIYILSNYNSWPINIVDSITQCLSYIEYPDSLGLACNPKLYEVCFTDSNIKTSISPPNFPTYHLGPLSIYEAKAGENDTIVYCVEDTTVKGVLLGAPAVEGVQYSWHPADSLNHTDIAQPFATPSVSTWYFVSLSDTSIQFSCQSRIDSVYVEVRDCTVGVDSPQSTVNSHQVRVYPNPVHDILYIVIENFQVVHPFTFRLYDAQGKVVITQEDVLQVTTKDLPGGIYFWEFSVKNRETVRGKVVKL